jgi:hypothetical protein
MLTAMRLVGASTIADLKPEMVCHPLLGIVVILKLVYRYNALTGHPFMPNFKQRQCRNTYIFLHSETILPVHTPPDLPEQLYVCNFARSSSTYPNGHCAGRLSENDHMELICMLAGLGSYSFTQVHL